MEDYTKAYAEMIDEELIKLATEPANI